jgi:hypothetical protein
MVVNGSGMGGKSEGGFAAINIQRRLLACFGTAGRWCSSRFVTFLHHLDCILSDVHHALA